MENGEYAIGVFLDLPKTFETINHIILLKKNLSAMELGVSSQNGSKII